MAFRWRAADGLALNAGLVAQWFFKGSGPVLLKKNRHPVPPLDPRMPLLILEIDLITWVLTIIGIVFKQTKDA